MWFLTDSCNSLSFIPLCVGRLGASFESWPDTPHLGDTHQAAFSTIAGLVHALTAGKATLRSPCAHVLMDMTRAVGIGQLEVQRVLAAV